MYKLYIKENIYDFILVLNYNTRPVKKGAGSAIFLHLTEKKFKVLRNYSVERFSESGFTQNIKGSALLGAPQWLRFFGYQYSSYNRKFQIDEVNNND